MDDVTPVRDRAIALMEEHLGHLSPPWHFRWDTARRRAGACHHAKRTISLSRHITELGSFADAEQTILHEIAHALCGKNENHGPQWLAVARSIGYTGRVRHTGPTPDHLAKWVGTCPAGHTVLRYRRPRNMVASCSTCHPRFDRAHLITWVEVG